MTSLVPVDVPDFSIPPQVPDVLVSFAYGTPSIILRRRVAHAAYSKYIIYLRGTGKCFYGFCEDKNKLSADYIIYNPYGINTANVYDCNDSTLVKGPAITAPAGPVTVELVRWDLGTADYRFVFARVIAADSYRRSRVEVSEDGSTWTLVVEAANTVKQAALYAKFRYIRWLYRDASTGQASLDYARLYSLEVYDPLDVPNTRVVEEIPDDRTGTYNVFYDASSSIYYAVVYYDAVKQWV